MSKALFLGVSSPDTKDLQNVSCYDTLLGVIKSFKDKAAETVFGGDCPKGFPNQIMKVARRKLEMIQAAVKLDDLRSPPNNRLEVLTRDRAGQHSIRINDQYRVCFVWTGQGAESVEIVDYH